MSEAVLFALCIIASALVILVQIILILAIVRLPGILRELERGNRQADAVIVSQLNEIIKRLVELERA
jgi:hypothetical protein